MLPSRRAVSAGTRRAIIAISFSRDKTFIVDAGMISARVARRWLQSLSIDGPNQKKDKGEGGGSPPTVTLVDVEMTQSGVRQSWGVYADGQKAGIVSVTDDDGDVQISGKDLDLGEGLTAQQAVAFILQGAHPKYYPKPGKTVELDPGFLDRARAKFK
jgi:hypothetical protein